MFAGVWLPGRSARQPVPGARGPMTPENRWSSPSGRPLASRGVYDSFCNVAATATGLVTVSKTGDSDRAASRISCRVSSSASKATR